MPGVTFLKAHPPVIRSIPGHVIGLLATVKHRWGWYGYVRTVRILLECVLVQSWFPIKWSMSYEATRFYLSVCLAVYLIIINLLPFKQSVFEILVPRVALFSFSLPFHCPVSSQFITKMYLIISGVSFVYMFTD